MANAKHKPSKRVQQALDEVNQFLRDELNTDLVVRLSDILSQIDTCCKAAERYITTMADADDEFLMSAVDALRSLTNLGQRQNMRLTFPEQRKMTRAFAKLEPMLAEALQVKDLTRD